MKQHVEFDIEWPEGETQPMWYVAPRTASCMHTLAFFGCLPDREDCHFTFSFNGPKSAIYFIEQVREPRIDGLFMPIRPL